MHAERALASRPTVLTLECDETFSALEPLRKCRGLRPLRIQGANTVRLSDPAEGLS